MEHIKNIEIKNFKSIRHAEIKDCRRVNVFIGYPNVGKSNILEALGLFSMNQEGPFDNTKNPSSPNKFTFNQICRIDEPIDLFFNKNYSEQLSVTIDKKYEIRLAAPTDFNSFHFDNILIDESFPNRSVGTQLSSISVSTKDYWIRWHATQTFQKDEVYNSIKLYLYNNQIQTQSNDFFSLNMPSGNNLAQIISSNEAVRLLFIDLLKQNNLKPHAITGKYGVAKELSNGVIVTFDSSLMADTLKRVLFHAAAIHTNENKVLLFEEPEAHMFPPYISKFTGDVIYDANKNQFFITTHSPFVLNDFMEDMEKDELAVYAVGYKKESGKTIVRKLSDDEIQEIYQYGIDVFFNLESYLMNEA